MGDNSLGYRPGNSVFHRLNGASKLLALILIMGMVMTSFDTRLLLLVAALALAALRLARIQLSSIRRVGMMMALILLINLMVTYLFAPQYGVALYHSRTLLWQGPGAYNLTAEQLFYETNLLLKYVCSIPLALVFLLTTQPSALAASLNRLGVPYKISYAVALAMRYIPTLQAEYHAILLAQQARGAELSSKGKRWQRLKAYVRIAWALIVTSLERVVVISHAMELRRFGARRQRSWYSAMPLGWGDLVLVLVAMALVLWGIWLLHLNHGRFYNPFLPSVSAGV